LAKTALTTKYAVFVGVSGTQKAGAPTFTANVK
jgi:hypothetical protein